MNVAYLINQYPQGSLTFVRREIRALERQGVDVFRVSIRRAPVTDPTDVAEAAKTHVLLEKGVAALLYGVAACLFTRPLRTLRAARVAYDLARASRRGVLAHLAYFVEACDLARTLRRRGRRHVHAHFGTNSAAVAMLCSIVGDLSYSFTVHGPEEFDRPDSLSLGKKIDLAAFVVGVSSFGRSQLMRWTPVEDWPKLQVVHCGLDESYFSGTLAPIEDSPRVVCIGRLVEQKGQLVLIEAVKKLHDRGVAIQARLVGDGPLRATIEHRVRELGIESCVVLAGWLNEAEVRQELLAARALVMPSFAEGLPVAIMEALALGRPVIATYVAGIPELATPGECGWLTPAGSVDALADALQDCLTTSPERLAHMAAVGAARAKERHSVETEAAKLRELFGRVAGWT